LADPWKQFRRRREPAWGKAVLTQGALLVAGAIVVGAIAAWGSSLRAASDVRGTVPAEAVAAVQSLDRNLSEIRGELEMTRLQLERATEIMHYSARYRIPADLSGAIYDIAVAEGIHPALGFQLVKVESDFRANAVSSMGAIGYTQVLLPTARIYRPGISRAELTDRETNLRLGFRFLKDLLRRFDNDLSLALVAYNRGPTRVDSIVAGGGNPSNGYSEMVLRGVSQPVRTTSAEGVKRGS
jgi:soluble lytic murein transglycosylase-like protein